MKRKMIYFKVPKEIWMDFEEKINKENKIMFEKNKEYKKYNKSSMTIVLLEKIYNGETTIDYSKPYDFSGNSKMHEFGITVPMEFWKKSRDFVTNITATGQEVKGGLGGIISGLVQKYNKGKIKI